MDLQLTEHVILVVGGLGLVGSAIVDRLRAEGATVIPASRRAEGGLVMDASDDESVAAGFARVHAEHGRLDGVVIAAAPSAQTLDPARNADLDQVLEALEGKSLTYLRVANAAIPSMREAGYGRIVGLSGQNAFLTGNLAGSVRNAAVIIAAKNLADSLAGTGVTVNTVSPGVVTTQPSAEVAVGKGGDSTPADIANLIAFLVSPLAGAISGESIAVGHRVRGVTSL